VAWLQNIVSAAMPGYCKSIKGALSGGAPAQSATRCWFARRAGARVDIASLEEQKQATIGMELAGQLSNRRLQAELTSAMRDAR
jgi:hypothetical protein